MIESKFVVESLGYLLKRGILLSPIFGFANSIFINWRILTSFSPIVKFLTVYPPIGEYTMAEQKIHWRYPHDIRQLANIPWQHKIH
jgi:hypothetical protein